MSDPGEADLVDIGEERPEAIIDISLGVTDVWLCNDPWDFSTVLVFTLLSLSWLFFAFLVLWPLGLALGWLEESDCRVGESRPESVGIEEGVGAERDSRELCFFYPGGDLSAPRGIKADRLFL